MDFVLANGRDLSDIADPLEEAVVASLFSWGQARPDDGIDRPYRRGWWADTVDDKPIGSRLWLLEREKVTESTRSRAQAYAKEALAWLLEEKLVKDLDVQATRTTPHRIDLIVSITRVDGTHGVFTFRRVTNV